VPAHRQHHRAGAGPQAPQAPPSAAPASSTRTPAPPPASTPAATPAVTVSYSLVQPWDGGFQGEFTIVNHGTAAIHGWQLAAAFPGDTIESAWDASFHTDGDTLLLDPPSYQLTIGPGASLAEHFTAAGTTTAPGSCTSNGAAC
jgi:endoglucanase